MRIFKNQAPQVLTYGKIADNASSTTAVCLNSGKVIPPRFHPLDNTLCARLRCAWMVFTGRADALLPMWQEETMEDLLRAATKKPLKEGRHG